MYTERQIKVSKASRTLSLKVHKVNQAVSFKNANMHGKSVWRQQGNITTGGRMVLCGDEGPIMWAPLGVASGLLHTVCVLDVLRNW